MVVSAAFEEVAWSSMVVVNGISVVANLGFVTGTSVVVGFSVVSFGVVSGKSVVGMLEVTAEDCVDVTRLIVVVT